MIEFDLQTPLNITDVRQDKLDIHLGEWIIYAEDPRISDFIMFLGRDRSNSRNPNRAFQASTSLDAVTFKKTIKILSSKHRNTLTPLFSGLLIIKRINSTTFSLKLQLSINPTRFCVYQNIGLRKRNSSGMHAKLFAKQNRISYGDEYSLDGNDNVLLNSIAQTNGSEKYYYQLRQRYIAEIINYVDEEIAEFNISDFHLIRFEPYYALRKIENYWDLSHENAVGAVKALEQGFRSITNTSLIALYENLRIESADSCIGLRCELRSGERLKIYAKTNKKIRMEIEHIYKNNEALTECRRYTTRREADFFNMIAYSEEQATSIANQFLTVLRQQTEYSIFMQGRPIDFITMIYRTFGNISMAEDLISKITTTNGISRTESKKYPPTVFAQLRKQNIIKYLGRPHSRYAIHPRFMHILPKLLSKQ